MTLNPSDFFLPTSIERPIESADLPWNEVPLGVGPAGRATWDVTVAPHLLIAGRRGVPTALRTVVAHFVDHPEDWRVFYLGNEDNLSNAAKSSEVLLDASSRPEHVLKVLTFLAKEAKSRLEVLAKHGWESDAEVPYEWNKIAVVVDETRVVLGTTDEDAYDSAYYAAIHSDIRDLLTDLVLIGPQVGIHVILSTAFLSQDTIGRGILDNVAARYVVGKVPSTVSQYALGSDSASQDAVSARGRGILSINGQEFIVQGYETPRKAVPGWAGKPWSADFKN